MYINPYLPQFNTQQFNQPQINQPQYGQQQFQQPVHGFVRVNGIEGARAYYLPPNSEMPLFDSNDGKDVMYVKTTDGAGYPTITVVDCFQRGEKPAVTDYVTRDELDRVYRDFSTQIEQMREAINGTVPTTAASEPTDAGVSDAAAPNGTRKSTRRVPAAS